MLPGKAKLCLNDAWSIPQSSPSPPANLCAREPSFPLKEKERRENNNMELFGSLLLTGCRCCTKCQITHARKKLMHEMDKLCGAHGVLLMHGICAWLCTKDYMQKRQDLYKRWLPERVPATAPYGKTYKDVLCSRSCSPECHLRSQGGQRRA